jgi:hypothetical protein
MVGSMLYGVCYNDSQCDISIKLLSLPSVKTPSKDTTEMTYILDILKHEMTDDLTFIRGEEKDKHSVFMSVSNHMVFNFFTDFYPSAYKTSSLLRAYLDIDERARPLAFFFRYIFKVDFILNYNFVSKSNI